MPTAMDQAAPEQMAAEQRTRTFSWVHVIFAVVVTAAIAAGATTLLLGIRQQGEEEDSAFLRAQNSKLMEKIAGLERSTSDQRATLDACGLERNSCQRSYDELLAATALELGSTDAVFKLVARQQAATVERFFDLILPPDPIDYAVAAALLEPTLAEQLRSDISWVPRTLGIQDGPDRISVLDHEGYLGIFGTRVGGYYGNAEEPERIWSVGGEFRDGKWIITNIATQR